MFWRLLVLLLEFYWVVIACRSNPIGPACGKPSPRPSRTRQVKHARLARWDTAPHNIRNAARRGLFGLRAPGLVDGGIVRDRIHTPSTAEPGIVHDFVPARSMADSTRRARNRANGSMSCSMLARSSAAR